MMYELTIEQEIAWAEEIPNMEMALCEAIEATLRHQGVAGPAELSLLLTGNEQIQELNRTYRGYDEPTDVLSFPNEVDEWEEWPEELAELDGEEDENEEDWGSAVPNENYLGDIAISLPYAAQQAAEQGHSTLAELRLLTVHGVLHLLGHDHAEPEEKAAMWAAQEAILAQLSD